MSEYDKKIEEVKALCAWLHEHQDDVHDHEDSIVLSVAVGLTDKVTSIAVGDAEDIAIMLAHLAQGCREQYVERNAQ